MPRPAHVLRSLFSPRVLRLLTGAVLVLVCVTWAAAQFRLAFVNTPLIAIESRMSTFTVLAGDVDNKWTLGTLPVGNLTGYPYFFPTYQHLKFTGGEIDVFHVSYAFLTIAAAVVAAAAWLPHLIYRLLRRGRPAAAFPVTPGPPTA